MRYKDGYTGLRYDYGYDAIGRLIRTDISKSSNGAAVGSTEYGYNTRGHLVSITNDIGGNAYGQYYSYSQTDIEGSLANAIDGLPTRYRALGVNTDYAYDSLNRLTKRNVDLATDIETLYTYKNSLRGSGYATTQLATEKLGGISYGYSYDNMGNITSIVKGSNAYRSYTYDSSGQLKTETLHDKNQVISYTYNHLGNITAKEVIQYPNSSLSGVFDSDLYEYYYSDDNKDGWNYLLTAYDADANGTIDETEKISYDDIGNPISYRGAAMAWRGRQLTGHSKNGVTSTFSYDADGLRSTKTVGGVKTEYQYVGDQLFYEKRGDSQEFYYFYDSYGNLSKIYYTFINTQNNTTSRAVYHTLTNAQGDVIALYNGSGSLVAQYEYDAWGNTLSIKNASGADITAWYSIAVANPIRYRGYYYDADLGLYYLQSRYYDSSIGRFINADGTLNGNGDVLGFNLFAYCGNNPVMFSDPSGHGLLDRIKSAVSTAWNKIYVAFNTRVLKKQPLPYQTVTEAAVASGNSLNTLTQGTNMEHGQGIIYDKYTGTYGLTDVIEGQHASVDFATLLSPKQDNLVALVHSHPCCDGHIGNEFSNIIKNPDGTYSGDWLVADSNEIDMYLAAPNGFLYLMSWDVGEYNQSEVSSSLPIDDSPINCGG